MAADKRTTVRLSEKLLRRARKTLRASTNEDAVTKALRESLIRGHGDLLRSNYPRVVSIRNQTAVRQKIES